MNLLLDTHTFLWFVNDDPRLSNHLKDLIESDRPARFRDRRYLLTKNHSMIIYLPKVHIHLLITIT